MRVDTGCRLRRHRDVVPVTADGDCARTRTGRERREGGVGV